MEVSKVNELPIIEEKKYRTEETTNDRTRSNELTKNIVKKNSDNTLEDHKGTSGAKNLRSQMNFNKKTMKSVGMRSTHTKKAQNDYLSSFVTPKRSVRGPKSMLYSTASRYKEDKISKICESTTEPFRKTQTRINGRLKDYTPTENEEGNQGNWEESMDKTFENISLLVRQKKDAKEDNIYLRNHLTETLDELDEETRMQKQLEKEIEAEKKKASENTSENNTIKKELDRIKKILGKEANSVIKEGDKLGDELKKCRYKVSKLQRELETSRSEQEVVLNHQRYEQIEEIQLQITEAEEELMSLEHECRNSTIQIEKQAKRLKEKQKMIDEMVSNQDKITSPYGNVVIKQNTRDPELEYFSERLKRIVNN
ncbi:unnamed protein product [Moneuplotes crassus]|uniref:Uncharacterized protein n=1 Tax=Euplotes crassus TaxID=5936 RepID=A0AAD1UME8_EUPCR|nr:unnamed protein product [Moneuplotes crassus]